MTKQQALKLFEEKGYVQYGMMNKRNGIFQ